jgi:protein-disulfide isomerase
LNPDAVRSCLTDPKTREALVADIEEGRRIGVQATPTLLINGKKLPRVEDFVSVVDKEAQAKGFPPLADAKGH